MRTVGLDGRIIDDSQPNSSGLPLILQPLTDVVGLTGAIAAPAITSPNDGQKHQYRISIALTITVLGSAVINAQVVYTDDNGVARTRNILLANTAGTTIQNSANALDAWTGVAVIEVNPNTSITVQTAGTFTGATYNFHPMIELVR